MWTCSVPSVRPGSGRSSSEMARVCAHRENQFQLPATLSEVSACLGVRCAVIYPWRRADSNRRPPACKAGALPAELRPPVCLRRLRTTTLHTAPDRWITSQHLTDRAEMRDADMSVSTGQSVGDVRPRFISAEGLRLTRSSSSPPPGWPSSSETNKRRASRPRLRARGPWHQGSRRGTPSVPGGMVYGQSPDRFTRVRWPRSPIPARSGR